jgi:hypothetical protein
MVFIGYRGRGALPVGTAAPPSVGVGVVEASETENPRAPIENS